MISDKAIQEYKEIFKDEYGQDLTEAEAREQGERLLKFFEILIKIDQRNKQNKIMRRIKFSDLSAVRDRFDKVLTSLGLPIKNYDRIHTSFSLIDGAVGALEKNMEVFPKNKEKRVKLLYALQDISELNQIINTVPKWGKKVITEKLKRFLKGSILPSEESLENSFARNTGFELWLASLFSQKGYQSKISTRNPDLFITVSGRKYFLECKRVYSENGVESVIKDAFKQLTRQTENSDNIGVIAISISKIIPQDDLMLISGDGNKASEDIYKLEEKFILKNQHLWKITKQSNIVGVIVHFGCIGASIKDGIPFHANFITVNNIYDNDYRFKVMAEDFKYLNSN